MSAADRLTDEEARDLRAAAKRDEWSGEWNSLPTAVERILAARGVRAPGDTSSEDALAEVIADALCDDAWEGHEDPLTLADVERIAAVAARTALAARPAPDTLAAEAAEGQIRALEASTVAAQGLWRAAEERERLALLEVDRLRALLAGRPDASPEGGEQRG